MVNSQWIWIPSEYQTWDCNPMTHVKDLEKENKNLKVMSLQPRPQQSICLPLHSAWISWPPDPQTTTFLPGRSLERVLIFRGAFIKIIWCKSPASYSSRSAYFQTCPPGAMGVFLCGPVPVLWMVPVLWNPWNTSITKITMCWVLSGWQDCFLFSLSWAVFVYIGNVLFLNIQTVSTST